MTCSNKSEQDQKSAVISVVSPCRSSATIDVDVDQAKERFPVKLPSEDFMVAKWRYLLLQCIWWFIWSSRLTIVALVLFIMHTIMIISFFVTFNRSYGRDAFVNAMSVIQMFVLTYFMSTVFLIYGATKGNRHLMLPFVSVSALITAYIVCYELLCCFFLVSQLLSLAVSFVFVGVYVFIIYVILSHYQELKKYTLDNREDDEVSIVNSV